MTTPRYRTGRQASAVLALLASAALTAGCLNLGASGAGSGGSASSSASETSSSPGSSGASGSATTDPQEDDGSADAWTTISSAVAEASTGATTSGIQADNAEVSDVSTEQDDAGAYDASSATTISLSGTSATVDGEGASAEGSTVTITAGGTYVVSGEATDAQLVVNAPDAEVRLVLDGASLTSTTGAAVDIQDAGEAVIVLAQGSTNTLADAQTYADTSDDAPTAALFSSDTLTITGTGALEVTGSYNDGISSKNGLVITGGTTITVDAADDGLRGKDYLVVESGTLDVTAGGDALKSSEDDDETKGFVALGEAGVTLTSGDDGITAHTDVTVAGTTLSITAGGGQANAVIKEQPAPGQEPTQPAGGSEGGTDAEGSESSDSSSSSPKGITAGVSYTQDSGTVTVDAAHEGVEAAFVNVGGGRLVVTSGDDGINASSGDLVIEGYEGAESDTEADDGSVLTISGGEVQISYASSDGIDSNGSAYVTGGVVVISGQAGAMDGAIDVNGQSQLVGVSGSPSVATGDTLTITDSSGNEVASLEMRFTAEAITVLGLTEGEEYTVSSTSGGSATGTASALSAGRGGPGGGDPQGGQPGDPGAPQDGTAPAPQGGTGGTSQDGGQVPQDGTSQS